MKLRRIADKATFSLFWFQLKPVDAASAEQHCDPAEAAEEKRPPSDGSTRTFPVPQTTCRLSIARSHKTFCGLIGVAVAGRATVGVHAGSLAEAGVSVPF